MADTERAHAIIPKYRGGHLIPDNRADLSRPLHAFHHLLIEEATPAGRDKEANQWAKIAIISRMRKYEGEMEEYRKLETLHEIDRRKGNWH